MINICGSIKAKTCGHVSESYSFEYTYVNNFNWYQLTMYIIYFILQKEFLEL